MENVYYNVFRDHMMGQPILGDIDNIRRITRDMVVDFHARNYFGENVVVVGAGNVHHQQLVDLVEQHFSSLPRRSSLKMHNLEKAVFNPGLLMIRDDEMYNSSIGVFYDAPSWKHEDFYSFLLLQRMIGSYEINQNSGHLNDVSKQYNAMHSLLGEYPDITRAECLFSPYSDCGIFGNWFFGNEVFTRPMNWLGCAIPTNYGEYVTEVEVVRARNVFWGELMGIQSASDVMQQIGPQMLYLNRRVPRSEMAKRVSHVDADFMRQLCYKWFYDAEPSFTNWGPIQDTSSVGSYKYFKVNTMNTVSNLHHSLST